jgi:Ca2+-binding EF-hand superfamily protein
MAETYSILTRGTLREKLEWIYSFYSLSSKGKLSRMDFVRIVQMFYSLSNPEEREFSHDQIFNTALETFQV